MYGMVIPFTIIIIVVIIIIELSISIVSGKRDEFFVTIGILKYTNIVVEYIMYWYAVVRTTFIITSIIFTCIIIKWFYLAINFSKYLSFP